MKILTCIEIDPTVSLWKVNKVGVTVGKETQIYIIKLLVCKDLIVT